MLGPSEVNGLPIHPLIVHLPVVLVPLSLLGVVAALIRPPWRRWMLPLVTAATGVSLVAVQLAVASGRELEDTLDESKLIERHESLALQARPLVALFFVVTALALYLDRRTGRSDDEGTATPQPQPLWTKAALPLAVVAGLLATTWVARTGEAGAKATWIGEIGYDQRKASPAGHGEGGEDERGEDDHGGSGSGSGSGSSEGKDSGSTPASGDAMVDISNFAFGPKETTIKVGDTVTWTNKDSAKHSAKSRKGEGPEQFTTKDLAQGDSDTVTFKTAGTYDYVCGFHTYMKGKIIVTK